MTESFLRQKQPAHGSAGCFFRKGFRDIALGDKEIFLLCRIDIAGVGCLVPQAAERTGCHHGRKESKAQGVV